MPVDYKMSKNVEKSTIFKEVGWNTKRLVEKKTGTVYRKPFSKETIKCKLASQ